MTPLKATYNGMQDSLIPGRAPFALWTILEPIGAHPVHSTLSLNTLHALDCEPYQPEEDDHA